MAFEARYVNHKAFENPDEEGRYWVGFFAADGCFTIGTSSAGTQYKHLLFSLHERDAAAVHRFAEYLESEYSVKNAKPRQMAFTPTNQTTTMTLTSITSENLWDDLHTLGVTKDKTKHTRVVDKLAQSRDFWRGVCDGDGTVSVVRNRGIEYPTITLCGNYSLMEQFQAFVQQEIGVTAKIGSARSIFRVGLTGAPARDLIEILYKDAVWALPRKNEKALLCMQWKRKIHNKAYTG